MSVYDFTPPPMNWYPRGTANIDYGASGVTTVRRDHSMAYESTTSPVYVNPSMVHPEGFGIALPNMYATQSGIVHPYPAQIASNYSNVQATHMGHSAPPAIPMAPWGGYSVAQASGFLQHSLAHP
jgi:hypothetical protein